jgi:hypothetical protein
MAKQVGHVKAVGTVDENVNFYFTELDGYIARLLPGVDTKRFWNDPAFEGSRRSAETNTWLLAIRSIAKRAIGTPYSSNIL